MKELNALVQYANSRGFNVSFVGKKVLHDYWGMNPEAAGKFDFRNIKSKEIQVEKGLSLSNQKDTLRHEIIERNLILAGMEYWPAHLTALKLEKAKITPEEVDALARLGVYEVVHVHDDGDLTVKANGKEIVVTTEGKTYEEGKMKTGIKAMDINKLMQAKKNLEKAKLLRQGGLLITEQKALDNINKELKHRNKSQRPHTPIASRQQQKLFGAELSRREAGSPHRWKA